MVGRAVISFCGLLALLLSAIGLYSVLAFAVRTRTREIGVRIALGAQRADVMNLVLREALLVAISGIAGGLLAATAATGLLKAWLYGVQARDLISFAIASAALLITALIAAFLPAHHAAKVDPIVALRSE
jgi:ABC-type antimicrobial peptide transport system permease subunit